MKLAIKINNNYYFPLSSEFIDIISESDLDSLEHIDEFTNNITLEELYDSVVRSNIIDKNSLINSEFVIIVQEGKKTRELMIHTKDDTEFQNFNCFEYLLENIHDKNIINQINNFFKSKKYLSEDIHTFVDYIKYDIDENLLETLYLNLDYSDRRLLKGYLYKIYMKKNSVKRSLVNE